MSKGVITTYKNNTPSAQNAADLASRQTLPFLTTKKELAKIFACSVKHIEVLTARGILKPLKLGRSVRFRRDAVVRVLEQLEGRQ